MQKYYFDVYDGDKVVEDAYGESFTTVQEAADQAAGLLVDLARDLLPNGRGQDFGVAVRTDASSDVYSAALIFRDSYPGPKGLAGAAEYHPILSIPNPVDLIRQSRETRATTKRIAYSVQDSAGSLADAIRQAAEAVKAVQATMAGIARPSILPSRSDSLAALPARSA